METQHHQIHKESERKKDKEESKGDVQVARPQAQLSPPSSSSSSSSPAHEFTFTISLHPTATKPPPPQPNGHDLSPADEIFFHGHLLPLHLLSHIPPRSSTNSLDNLPIKHLHKQENKDKSTTDDDHVVKGRVKTKSKSFSLSKPKWMASRPKVGGREKEEEENKNNHRDYDDHNIKTRNKSKFEFVKRCMRLVKPLFHSFRREGDYRSGKFREKFSSCSGNLRVKSGGVGGSNKLMRGRRGEFSAPVSMRGSPTNSGRLVAASGSITPTTTSSDSTMEELQAAIQAAIAHCKKSIATPVDHVQTVAS